MRHLQGLVPYALASVAVVVASAIALGTTIRAPLAGPAAPTSSAAPTPLGSRATLSESGRMAYWRSAQSGQLELWVSDLDGGRRWTIATAGAGSDVALTRWSPDGNALAYIISGQMLAISRLDGSTAYLEIPAELRTQRWRIVSFEWAPDASRVAATIRAANGLSNISDVYIVTARATSVWERLTLLGDAFAGKWISPTQLFIEEASGAVLVLDTSTKEVRPITGMPVTSAQIGRDGRAYFVGGQFVVSDVATQPVANGWVWSATIDGEDLKREVKDGHDNLRLFGMLLDGRAVVGVPGGVYVAGDAYVPLAFQSGTVRRVVVSPDGKRIVGITDQRILLVDPTKVPRSVIGSGLPPAEAATVLLSNVREADVWFPSRPAAPVKANARFPENGPKAKLAFILGKGLYMSAVDGSIRAVATEQSGTFIGVPKWSPTGDRVAAPVALSATATASVVVVAGAAGSSRFEVPARFPQGVSWTSDGTAFGVWIPVPQKNQELTTQVYDATTGTPREEIPGRATFTAAGMLVLSDGDLETGQSIRTRQRLDLVTSSGLRTITDAATLAAAPLLKDLGDASLPALIDQVTVSADGQYIAVNIARVRPGSVVGRAVVVVRVADGTPVWQMPVGGSGGPSEVMWSSSGHLLAWWTAAAGGIVQNLRRTFTADPVSGRALQAVEGRFAGWADGPPAPRAGTSVPETVPWFYVARDEGLFAYSTDGAGPVRIGPIGVPVSATKP